MFIRILRAELLSRVNFAEDSRTRDEMAGRGVGLTLPAWMTANAASTPSPAKPAAQLSPSPQTANPSPTPPPASSSGGPPLIHHTIHCISTHLFFLAPFLPPFLPFQRVEWTHGSRWQEVLLQLNHQNLQVGETWWNEDRGREGCGDSSHLEGGDLFPHFPFFKSILILMSFSTLIRVGNITTILLLKKVVGIFQKSSNRQPR